ncbi:MAG: hypothetical protein J7641_14030 [Cyanobacteria bacterium SID2]|nr:hypothetical protein [Cyanobacteria bacterium SID2]MBP0005157.1 hypothetical protein [Cyanobacteria bacterium SBC]
MKTPIQKGASHFYNRNPTAFARGGAEGGGVASAQSSRRGAEGLFYELILKSSID